MISICLLAYFKRKAKKHGHFKDAKTQKSMFYILRNALNKFSSKSGPKIFSKFEKKKKWLKKKIMKFRFWDFFENFKFLWDFKILKKKIEISKFWDFRKKSFFLRFWNFQTFEIFSDFEIFRTFSDFEIFSRF